MYGNLSVKEHCESR